MKQDEIIEMARQAGFLISDIGLFLDDEDNQASDDELLEAFAKLVAAKERDACIVDIQMHIPRSGRDTLEYKMAMRMIERIRARGEA